MKITPKKAFVIYGAGEVGTNAAIALKANGYLVPGFLDRCPPCASILNISVYRADAAVPWDKKDVIVIIALANGNLHKEVAEGLYQNGYCHIVFLPIAYQLPPGEKMDLIAAYNMILCGQGNGISVCNYEKYHFRYPMCQDAIIKESDGYVWTLIPQEILFSENHDTWKGDKNKLFGIPAFSNRNIVLVNWYRKLFQYYEGDRGDCEPYFDGFKAAKSNDEKKRIAVERHRLYQIYKSEFNRGLSFFIETAPLAEWCEKGYFNLVGGHHRTTFLLEQGVRLFPAKITRADFDMWCNYEALERFEAYCRQDFEACCEIPVPHPTYTNCICERENARITLLDSILNFFEPIDMHDQSILDVSQADGYFARMFSRQGAGKITCCEPDFYERVNSIFDLLYIKDVYISNEFDAVASLEYDVVFAVNPTSFVYEKPEKLLQLSRHTRRYMFVELKSRDEDILDRLMAEGGYTSCIDLAREVIRGEGFIVFALKKGS